MKWQDEQRRTAITHTTVTEQVLLLQTMSLCCRSCLITSLCSRSCHLMFCYVTMACALRKIKRTLVFKAWQSECSSPSKKMVDTFLELLDIVFLVNFIHFISDLSFLMFINLFFNFLLIFSLYLSFFLNFFFSPDVAIIIFFPSSSSLLYHKNSAINDSIYPLYITVY